jgi:hypothetical protein
MSFLGSWPANGIFIKHIPVLKRMTAASFIYALSRALMHIITSFGLVYLTEGLGYYGIWVVIFPVTVGYIWGIRHFEILEGIRLPKIPITRGGNQINFMQENQKMPSQTEDKKFA